jgi:hypothetical protein
MRIHAPRTKEGKDALPAFVILTGPDIMISSRAFEVLSDVPGVKTVRNDPPYQQQRTSSAAPASEK